MRANVRGSSLVEYLVVLGLVALLVLGGWRAFGSSVASVAQAEGDRVRTLEEAPIGDAPEHRGEGERVAAASRASTACEGPGCGDADNCFVAGTPVTTPEGLRPIEAIEPGDVVLAWDEATGTTSWRPVTRTFVTHDKQVLDVEVTRKDGSSEKLGVTAEHPFWIPGKGWTAAGDLEAGLSALATLGERAEVLSVTERAESTTTYNFEVDSLHTYLVGTSRIVVHNDCGELRAAPDRKGGGPRQDNTLGGPPRPHRPPPPPPARLVPMHASWNAGPIAGAFQGGSLDVNRVTPAMLAGWTPRQYQQFMQRLSGTNVTWEGWGLGTGLGISSNGSNTAAAFVYARLHGEGTGPLRARLFAANPSVLLDQLDRSGMNGGIWPIPVFTFAHSGQDVIENFRVAFDDMRALDGLPGGPRTVPGPESQQALARLVERALTDGQGRALPAEQMRRRLQEVMTALTRDMRTPDELGFATGVVIAGLNRVLDRAGSANARRQILEGGVFDGGAALTGGIPVVGPFIAAAIVGARTARQLSESGYTSSSFANVFLGQIMSQFNELRRTGNLPRMPDGRQWTEQDLTNYYQTLGEALRNNGYN